MPEDERLHSLAVSNLYTVPVLQQHRGTHPAGYQI